MDLDTLIHNFKGHLSTINNHKRMVMEYCFRVGLYKQGLLHDLSKYCPQEFIPGVIYYQGDRSPNNAQREALGYSDAWLHHKGHNKHHYEYWIDYPTNKDAGLVGMKMPVKYVVEMFCDRVAARPLCYPPGYRPASAQAVKDACRTWGRLYIYLYKKTRSSQTILISYEVNIERNRAVLQQI